MEEQRPIRPMSPSGPTPASGGEAAAQASKPPSLQTSEADARARSARVRSDLAREELETVKRTLRAVEAQANAADPASTPASAPSGDYIRTTFRRAGGVFNHRWKVTVETVTGEDGTVTRRLRIAPGSLWRNEGTGAVDLNVVPDGSSVTVGDDGMWAVENAATGSLYVADGGAAYPLVFGNPDSESRPILLRVADLSVTAGGATLIQRQVGDALYSPGGGGGLQLGPLEYEAGNKRFVRYMGTWVYAAGSGVWNFAKAVRTDGGQYPAAEIIPSREMLFRSGGEVYVALRPDIGPTPTRWLAKRTETIVGGISYSEPESDADTGALSASELTFTYFSDTAATEGETIELLYTQVEAANEASHFEG